MTVANVRERSHADFIEVIFLESARFYRLPLTNPSSAGLVKKLTDALAAGKPLEVGLASIDSDIIEEVL